MRLLIGTSWKMHLTPTEAGEYCDTLLPLVGDFTDRDLFVLPPFPAIWPVRERLRGSQVAWGAQHVHPADWGAHTGDVSAPMLADLGCTYVELGHFERRREYGETDESVLARVHAVQRWGMTAIVCVGEGERGDLRRTISAIDAQLRLLGEADPERLVVAYEPAWAIGDGAASAKPPWIGRVVLAIQERLDSIGTSRVRVIYGGSVDEASAAGILDQPGVNGLFVGRNALDPLAFARVARTPVAPVAGPGVAWEAGPRLAGPPEETRA